MTPIRVTNNDVGAALASAIGCSALLAGMAATVVSTDCVNWATATFTGARHELTVSAPQGPALEAWLAGLADADLAIEGHLVVDIAVGGASGGLIHLRALTVEDGPKPVEAPQPPAGAPSPGMLAAFEAWRLAELAAHYASPCPDEVMNELVDRSSEKLAALSDTPAANADDLLLKMFPLMLCLFEPKHGNPPLRPDACEKQGSVAIDGHRAMMLDLGRISPTIAEAMLAPHPNELRGKW